MKPPRSLVLHPYHLLKHFIDVPVLVLISQLEIGCAFLQGAKEANGRLGSSTTLAGFTLLSLCDFLDFILVGKTSFLVNKQLFFLFFLANLLMSQPDAGL